MTHPRFYLVDVFAEKSYTGNPLAVVIGSELLSDTVMQQLAAETNFSETTFVQSGTGNSGQYNVRIFTPSQEIAFAGHPILGTAWVIRHHLARGKDDNLLLNIGVGQVPVRFTVTTEHKEVAWFRAPSVTFGKICEPDIIAPMLGLAREDIDDHYPVQQIIANTSAMIVPLRSLAALRRSKLDLEAYAPLMADGYPPLTYLFSRQTHDDKNDLCARFFFDAHGVREDPATGNGAAFLGFYMLKYRFLPQAEFSLRIEQGHEVRRPSLILLHANNRHGEFEISVGGTVLPVAQGVLC